MSALDTILANDSVRRELIHKLVSMAENVMAERGYFASDETAAQLNVSKITDDICRFFKAKGS